MTARFDSHAIGGMDAKAATNMDAMLPACKFTIQQTVVSPIWYVEDDSEVYIGQWTANESDAQTIYTCNRLADSPNKGGTNIVQKGQLRRWDRPAYECYPENVDQTNSPGSIFWEYASGLSSDQLSAAGERFSEYIWISRDGLRLVVQGRRTSGDAVPTCSASGGWHPNDPATDGITECENPSTDIEFALWVYTRSAVGADWTLESPDDGWDLFVDSFAPTVNEEGKCWAKKGRYITTSERDQFRVWNADEDPQTASVTTITMGSGTITSWVHEGQYTFVLNSANDVYVYDGTTLAQTLSAGSGSVYNYSARDEWLVIQRPVGTARFYKRDSGGTYNLHSTDTTTTGTLLLCDHGTGVENGTTRWAYDPDTDAWSSGNFSAGSDLIDDGFSWTSVTDDSSVYFENGGERIAFAAVQ